MTIDARIGIIGGNGWMGSAIAAAAVNSGVLAAENLTLSGRTQPPAAPELAAAHWTRDNRELADKADVIMLSVPPQQFADIDIHAAGKLVISVMAGITVQAIEASTGADAVVRAIPNAAAAIGQSFTPWFAAPAINADDKQFVRQLFDACGGSAEVEHESHIDHCVAMTGSGAAYPALLAEALVAHAVASGLPRDFARRAAKGVLVNASQLFAGEATDTADIVQQMIDYGGTTGAALQATRERGFDAAVAQGLQAALDKAAALGTPK